MTEVVLALAGGIVLGLLFYGGLWWTLSHIASFRSPALALVLGALLRTLIVLGGFHALAGGEWRLLLLCLAGFALARLVVTRATRLPATVTTSGAADAP